MTSAWTECSSGRRLSGLDEAFIAKMDRFKTGRSVFTNVIFDTSQPHANVIFEDMFTWLDDVLKVARDIQ